MIPVSKPTRNASRRILIVDDDPSQRSLLQTCLRDEGYSVMTAASGKVALELIPLLGDLTMIVSDVRMPGISGLQLLKQVREKLPHLPFLMVTAYASIRDAVNAMRDGAVNYLAKPVDLDELLATVRKTTCGVSDPLFDGASSKQIPAEIVAASPLMKSVFDDAARIAPSESRVFITGEEGVGKEVLARLIHRWSSRMDHPFAVVHCASTEAPQLAGELFGHGNGSVPGGTEQEGALESVSNGTLLLKEMGGLPLSLQERLLRVITDGIFCREGGTQEYPTQARILVSTTRDLESMVQEGRFREDLWYRLNTLELNIPPLRERREDVVPLAEHFLSEFADSKVRLSSSASDCLQNHSWPGNVKELQNVMKRVVLVSRSDVILPEHLPSRIQDSSAHPIPVRHPKPGGSVWNLEDIERDTILQALKSHDYNRTETAKSLAISRRALTYKLQRLREQGFQVDPFHPD